MVTAALLALLLTVPSGVGGGRQGQGSSPPSTAGGKRAAVPAAPTEKAAPVPPPVATRRLGEWPAKPSGKTVSIEEHVSVDDALDEIARAAGWNLIANTGRLGERTLVVTMRSAPVEEAIDAVLEGSPLVATRRGNTVTVAPGRPATPSEQRTLSGFDRPTGRRFSGDFSDTPVDQALRKVADAAGLSVVFSPGMRGSVNGHFKDAPIEEVLRAILSQAGLVATREGSILTVAREGGRSLVIRGGKRGFAIQLEGEDADIGGESDRSVRDPMRDSRERGARQRRGGHDGDDGGRRGRDRVLHGDQVIGAGERARDVVVVGGSVRLEPGAVARQVTAILGSVDLGPGASVDREAVAIGGDIHVADGARVGADAVSIGGKIVIDDGGEVEGEQTSIGVPGLGGLLTLAGRPSWESGRESPLWRLGSALGQFAVFFLLGLLVLTLFPRRIEAVTGSLVNAPVKALLTGMLGTIALPVVLLLLVVTVVGIPFIAVIALGIAVAAAMGYTALALYFGRALPFHFVQGTPVVQLALGTALLVAVGQIPILGFLSWIAAWIIMAGVVLRTRFGQPPIAPPPVYSTTAPPTPPAAGT